MIKWYTSESEQQDIFKFCTLCSGDDPTKNPARINMDPWEYMQKPHTLMYKLFKEKMFDTGGYGLYIKDDKILGGSGYYVSKIHPQIGVCGVRMYTVPGRQTKYIHSEMMYKQFDLLKELGMRGYIITWNGYNKNLMDRFVYVNTPENHRGSFLQDGEWYRKPGVRIQPHTKLPFPVYYNYSKQWITYHCFDEEFEDEMVKTLWGIGYDKL